MSRRKESQYVFTPGAPTVGTVKIPGHIELNDILLIINATENVVIYNPVEVGKGGTKTHSHPALGVDPDFPYSLDGICTLNLDYNTSSMSSTDELIIYIDDNRRGLKIRPYDFGVDAVERLRVSNPKSIIDADFEYGLQSSKWQNLGLNQNYPSFSDGSGPFLTVTAATSSGGATGYSTITLTISGTLPAAGSVIYVSGTTSDLATGAFMVLTSGAGTITYLAKGIIAAGSILTSFTVVREGALYTSAALDVASITAPGGASTVTINFNSPHNLIPGSPIFIYDSTAGTQAYEGSFFANNIVSDTQITFDAGQTVPTTNTTTAVVYAKTDAFYIHRPFDGGVLLGPYYPIYGLSAKRQTKRYFRYQSGKGILFSTGTLLCPVFDIESITFSSPLITVTTNQLHGLQAGATVEISGVSSTNYNGTYTVNTVTGDKTFTVSTAVAPTVTPGILSDSPQVLVTNWRNAAVRTGMYDDTNGLFWEYDGQELYAVKRSSTQQLSGTIAATVGSQNITGTNTKFTQQLVIGDYIQIRGQRYQISSIDSDTVISIAPEYRGTANISGSLYSKIMELRIPSSKFNFDVLDGTGPSGYNIHLDTMQMLAIQYTWYGAGFVDFMVRGPLGEFITAHRIANNNFNTEAYMRSGNLPARYECLTGVLRSSLTAQLLNTNTTSMTLADASRFPTSGTVLVSTNVGGGVVEHELITYTGKSGNNLTGLTRTSSYSAFINGANRTFTGDNTARTHAVGSSVRYMNVTCAPVISHWGSAVIMDGGYDEDTGYVFTQSRSNISIAGNTTQTVLLFRPAPSVSENLPGRLGDREVINRSQTQLLEVEVNNNSARNIEIAGILNPNNSAIDAITWNNAYVATVGGASAYQPSFAQYDSTFTAVPTGGELLFRGISSSGTTKLDLSGVKEIQNSVIGGNGTYPNGPEVLALVIHNNNAQAASIDITLKWKEAQA